MRVIMDKLVLQHDRAEYHWTLIGTNTGPGGTGYRVRISGFELWQIGEEGLIASSQGRFDATEYRHQLEQEFNRRDPSGRIGAWEIRIAGICVGQPEVASRASVRR